MCGKAPIGDRAIAALCRKWESDEGIRKSCEEGQKWLFNEDGHYVTFVDKKQERSKGTPFDGKTWFQILEAFIPKYYPYSFWLFFCRPE